MEQILVVVDMQNDFIDGALGTKEAMNIVPYVIDKIKAYKDKGKAIYFTQDTHTENYLETQEGQHLPVPHCIRGTKGWELHPQIQALSEALQNTVDKPIIFEKGGFGAQELAQVLKASIKDMSQTEIELVGLCTDICVLSNAILLKTYMPEVVIKVDGACCAGVTPQSHENALEAMKMCQIQIM